MTTARRRHRVLDGRGIIARAVRSSLNIPHYFITDTSLFERARCGSLLGIAAKQVSPHLRPHSQFWEWGAQSEATAGQGLLNIRLKI